MSDAQFSPDRLAGLDLKGAERLAEDELRSFRDDVGRVNQELSRAIVGQERVVRELVLTGFAGGHALVEGAPGLGKTLLGRSVATALGLEFGRVQCTPDLIPADVTGTNILIESEGGARELAFRSGPIFAGVVLADEINRATPKTQSAFLEAMEERQVTVAGRSYPLPEPFMVLATENPIEMEGTFPLPEAQLDRFMFKILIGFPKPDELRRIARETTGPSQEKPQAVLSAQRVLEMQRLVRRIPIASDLIDAAVRVVCATHPGDDDASDEVRRFVRYGASPRAAQALILGGKVNAALEGRCHVSAADLARTAQPALRHRVLLDFEASTASVGIDELVEEIVARVLR